MILTPISVLFFTSSNPQLFRNRNRTARRISRRIDSLSGTRTKRGSEHRKKAYAKLLVVSLASLKQAQAIHKILLNIKSLSGEKVTEALRLFIPRIVQVIE